MNQNDGLLCDPIRKILQWVRRVVRAVHDDVESVCLDNRPPSVGRVGIQLDRHGNGNVENGILHHAGCGRDLVASQVGRDCPSRCQTADGGSEPRILVTHPAVHAREEGPSAAVPPVGQADQDIIAGRRPLGDEPPPRITEAEILIEVGRAHHVGGDDPQEPVQVGVVRAGGISSLLALAVGDVREGDLLQNLRKGGELDVVVVELRHPEPDGGNLLGDPPHRHCGIVVEPDRRCGARRDGAAQFQQVELVVANVVSVKGMGRRRDDSEGLDRAGGGRCGRRGEVVPVVHPHVGHRQVGTGRQGQHDVRSDEGPPADEDTGAVHEGNHVRVPPLGGGLAPDNEPPYVGRCRPQRPGLLSPE